MASVLKFLMSLVEFLNKITPSRLESHRRKALDFLERWAALRKGLLLLALLPVLSSCASLPPDVAALKAENERLKQELQACQQAGDECARLLKDCEALLP